VCAVWQVTKFKILIVFSQISVALPNVFNIKFPLDFMRFVRLLSIANLDFSSIFSFGCVINNDFYTSLLMYTLLPIMLCTVTAGVYFIYIRQIPLTAPDRAKRILSGQTTAVSTALTITYLSFPGVSSRLFQTYNCEQFDDGTVFLKGDYSVSCLTSKHKLFEIYAGLMIMVRALSSLPPHQWCSCD
jgi:hypothetical protein